MLGYTKNVLFPNPSTVFVLTNLPQTPGTSKTGFGQVNCSPVNLLLKWQNINKFATESIGLVLTPENHHKSHTKSLPRLHWCKMVNFGKICVFHIKLLKTGKIFYF
jgi:hypothetical protein